MVCLVGGEEGDPEIGVVEVRFDNDGEPFVVLAVDEDDTFTESRYWQAKEWADIPINPTYGKAARLILSKAT